jgi:transcriptional regulator with XRE-family HTH domain
MTETLCLTRGIRHGNMATMNPVKSYRKRHGDMTLEEFGELVGVKKSAVSKWENGKKPSPRRCLKIEEATKGEILKWQLRPELWPAPKLEAAQ